MKKSVLLFLIFVHPAYAMQKEQQAVQQKAGATVHHLAHTGSQDSSSEITIHHTHHHHQTALAATDSHHQGTIASAHDINNFVQQHRAALVSQPELQQKQLSKKEGKQTASNNNNNKPVQKKQVHPAPNTLSPAALKVLSEQSHITPEALADFSCSHHTGNQHQKAPAELVGHFAGTLKDEPTLYAILKQEALAVSDTKQAVVAMPIAQQPPTGAPLSIVSGSASEKESGQHSSHSELMQELQQIVSAFTAKFKHHNASKSSQEPPSHTIINVDPVDHDAHLNEPYSTTTSTTTTASSSSEEPVQHLPVTTKTDTTKQNASTIATPTHASANISPHIATNVPTNVPAKVGTVVPANVTSSQSIVEEFIQDIQELCQKHSAGTAPSTASATTGTHSIISGITGSVSTLTSYLVNALLQSHSNLKAAHDLQANNATRNGWIAVIASAVVFIANVAWPIVTGILQTHSGAAVNGTMAG